MNCHATAIAESVSMTESSPKPMSAADPATAPAETAMMASITL